MIKQMTLAIITLMVSVSVYAGPITYNGYTLAEGSNYVTGGGLEWLRWDETTGKTIAEALQENSGWRIATTSEMATLLNGFFNISFDIGNSTSTDTKVDDATTNNFFKMFGNTSTGSLTEARVLFGDVDSANYDVHQAYVFSSYKPCPYCGLESAMLTNGGGGWSVDYKSAKTSIALVQSVSVPEPSSIMLLTFGLVGLMRSRRLSRR